MSYYKNMIPDLDENYLSKQSFLNLYNDSDKLSINESFESNFLDFNNSLYFDPIKSPNIGTQPTSSFLQNNNINSLLLSKENKGNNQKEERKEKGKKEEKEKIVEKEKIEEKEKKMLGRKKKNSNEKGKHDKYSQDNIIRRIKTLIIKLVLKKINIYINEINEVYNMKNFKRIYKTPLLKVVQKDILKTGNKQFLTQTLQEIFSNDISTKYKTSFNQSSYNQQIILKLLNEKNEEKRKKFIDLFKLTFLDCLKHFRGSAKHIELEGLTTLKKLMSENEFMEDPEYSKIFKYYVLNFEEVIKNKKSKKSIKH